MKSGGQCYVHNLLRRKLVLEQCAHQFVWLVNDGRRILILSSDNISVRVSLNLTFLSSPDY